MASFPIRNVPRKFYMVFSAILYILTSVLFYFAFLIMVFFAEVLIGQQSARYIKDEYLTFRSFRRPLFFAVAHILVPQSRASVVTVSAPPTWGRPKGGTFINPYSEIHSRWPISFGMTTFNNDQPTLLNEATPRSSTKCTWVPRKGGTLKIEDPLYKDTETNFLKVGSLSCRIGYFDTTKRVLG